MSGLKESRPDASGPHQSGESRSPDATGTSPQVGLFVTCLVDLFRPNVGFSAVALLEEAGCSVHVPPAQVCCGQPAWNSGDEAGTRPIAEAVIEAFAEFDFVVAPSGSCAGMLKEHYPELFAADPVWHRRALDLASRTHELVSFLVDEMHVTRVNSAFDGVCTYHDSCSGLRELGVKEQPRHLLKSVEGLSLDEMTDSNVCCGFGGTFCVKYPDISVRMVSDKARNISATSASVLLGGDMGCLMNMAGRLSREGSPVAVYHVAEVLAGRTDVAPVAGSIDSAISNAPVTSRKRD